MHYFLCNNEHLSYSDKLYRVLGLLQTRAILSRSQSSLLHSARATDISWGRARNSTRILSLLVSFSRSNSDSLLTFAERRTEKLPKGCERQQKVLSKSAVQKWSFSYMTKKCNTTNTCESTYRQSVSTQLNPMITYYGNMYNILLNYGKF